jgi:hypothetical protein
LRHRAADMDRSHDSHSAVWCQRLVGTLMGEEP